MTSIETLPAPDISAPLEDKWKRDQQAFRQFLPELRLAHRDEFVAIHEGRVVGSGFDKVEGTRRADERFGDIPIFVSRVGAVTSSPGWLAELPPRQDFIEESVVASTGIRITLTE